GVRSRRGIHKTIRPVPPPGTRLACPIGRYARRTLCEFGMALHSGRNVEAGMTDQSVSLKGNLMARALLGLALLLPLAVVIGCGPGQSKGGEAPPPQVAVAEPATREVTAYEHFTGRTEAKRSIDIRARVTGYLDKVMFKEGDDVKAGDPLFEIDPRPYKAE